MSKVISIVGFASIVVGLLLLLAIYWPVLSIELSYRFGKAKTVIVLSKNEPVPATAAFVMRPVDEQFGIVIPKIRANAKIIPNVDPYDSRIYQQALTKGVAHAKGSVFPGRVGNMFIFSHSSVNFFDALRYNSVFYLLDKLENGDEIYVYMNATKYIYRVAEKKLVEPNLVSYLTEKTNDKLLTLMTCWPPGTTFKRLIVRAILKEQQP